MAERQLLDDVLLALTKRGHRLFRNNSGLARYPDGSSVAYGVARPGGSDLIGWTSYTIQADDIGRKVAIFTAIEAKTGKLVPNEAQDTFLRIVRDSGGLGIWSRSEEDILRQVADWRPPIDR